MNSLKRLQSPRAVGLLALAALLVFFGACQLVAGVQSRELDPIVGGCTLPTGSGPQVRFANLAPNGDALDLCIRSSGASWGEPIILNGGTGCYTANGPFPKTGFTYGEISIAFNAPGSTIDVKTVMGGSNCNSTAVAEHDGIALQAAPTVTTLIEIGGASSQPKKLVALPEYNAVNPGSGGLIRFVNTLSGIGAMDVGIAATDQLPSAFTLVYNSTGIPYGGTLSKGEKVALGSVDANGYLTLLNTTTQLAIAPHGQTEADILFPDYTIPNSNASVYAVGLSFNDSYPLEALLCDESAPTAQQGNPLLLNCLYSALPTLSFDVWNPALYGPDSPDFAQREQQFQSGATNPIATRTSDVMCLVEVDTANDQNNIVTVGKLGAAGQGAGNFNYSYIAPTTSLTTPFSNGGKTQDGGTCPATGQPACAQLNSTSEGQAALNAAFTCMAQNCSSVKGSMSGFLNTTSDCLSTNCYSQLEALFINSAPCLDCVLVNVASSETYSGSLNTCTTNAAPALGYDGLNNSMILSKYPIINKDYYVLTSSTYRRSVLYAEVAFPGGLNVDFYCGFYITPLNATELPYTGCFGNGAAASEDEYLQENLWEAHQLTSWVASKTGASHNPAVIVGDWRVGLGSPDGGGGGMYPPPQGIGEATINYMASNMTMVSGQNWPAAGQCSDCPGTINSINGMDTNSYFTLQPFLYNWPNLSNGNPMLDEQLIFTQNVLSLNGSATPNAPVGPYYGINFHLLRPQVATKTAVDAGQ